MINFNEISLDSSSSTNMFNNVPNNIVVCINKTNILSKIYPQISSKTCHIDDCTDNWKLKQKKLNIENNENIQNDPNIIKYEYDGNCYSPCLNGYFNDDNNDIKCK